MVTHVEVHKAGRKLYLWGNGSVLKNYDVDLGFAPDGPKQFEGDGKTPEGQYFIDRRNPRSNFHLSLGISYPNEQDVENAKAAGREPGGDIFIHGRDRRHRWRNRALDWTAGCISLTNRDMEEIYWMVRVGTPITIRA